MNTETDKPNSAVIATVFALGTAAMIGGTAALIGLARGEVQDHRGEVGGFANLTSIGELNAEQRLRLQSAKLPIARAEAQLIAELQQDPSKASPPPPEPAATAGGDPLVAPDGSAVEGGALAPGVTGTAGTPEAPKAGAAPAPVTSGAVPQGAVAPAKGGGSAAVPPKAPDSSPQGSAGAKGGASAGSATKPVAVPAPSPKP